MAAPHNDYLSPTACIPGQEGVDHVTDRHMSYVVAPVYQWRSTSFSGDEVLEERVVPVASPAAGKFADCATVIGALNLQLRVRFPKGY